MAIAMTFSMLGFLPFDCLLTFPSERQVYIREHFACMYSTSAFMLARILADTPIVCLSAVIFATATHLMIGLHTSLLLYIGYAVLCIQAGVAVLHLIGAVSQNFEQANGLATMVLLLFMMISPGFLRQVPSWLEWCSSSSFLAHCMSMVADTEFEDFKGTEYESLISEGPAGNGLVICLVLIVVCRILTYFAFRFLYTGRPMEYLMHD
jgi:ABC-type transport system involved in multi-copper enzyme maturation permease subunit